MTVIHTLNIKISACAEGDAEKLCMNAAEQQDESMSKQRIKRKHVALKGKEVKKRRDRRVASGGENKNRIQINLNTCPENTIRSQAEERAKCVVNEQRTIVSLIWM